MAKLGEQKGSLVLCMKRSCSRACFAVAPKLVWRAEERGRRAVSRRVAANALPFWVLRAHRGGGEQSVGERDQQGACNIIMQIAVLRSLSTGHLSLAWN